jgi:RNA polymerase sigma factor (sigma-70 family)
VTLDSDTSLGGVNRRFPATRHSLIEALADAHPEERERAFGALVQAYWKPVYTYIRIKWRAGNEDAKDLTQEFFSRALEKDFFADYDAGRARFRTFLRVCLDRFLSNHRAAAARLKRGGGAAAVPLDFAGAERELDLASDTADPDEFFRQEWIRALFARAVDRLRAHLEARDRLAHYQVFERYDLAPEHQRPTYQALAEALQLPVTQVTNFLAAARREFRRAVLDELRAQAGSDAEFRAEARELLGIEQP